MLPKINVDTVTRKIDSMFLALGLFSRAECNKTVTVDDFDRLAV